MHAQIVSTYRSLMTSLNTLPDEIAAAQTDLTNAGKPLAETKKLIAAIDEALDLRKAALAIECATAGKNDIERKAMLPVAIANDHESKVLAKRRGDLEAKQAERAFGIASLTNDVDNLTRQFAAVGYATKLHAGLMAYLASAAPGKEFDVTFGADNAIAVNGNGTITAADAAELGL